jgi:ribosomal protein L40E
MLICEACGTENRDKARFCLGCAKSLTPTPDQPSSDAAAPAEKAKAPGPVQVCPACQASNPLAATVCKSCKASLVPDVTSPAQVAPLAAATSATTPRLLAKVGAAFLVLAVGAWWLGSMGRPSDGLEVSGAAPPPPELAVTATPSAPASTVTTTVSEAGSATVAEESASAVKATRAKKLAAERDRKKRVEREERDRVAAQEQQRAAQAQEQQRAEQAKRVAEQQAARDKAAERAAALAAARAQAVVAVKSVEQSCASSGNFFAREVCKVKTCGDAAFAKDPVCVRFRQAEAENRKELSF